jgi:dephospho-CoA kinase
MNVGLTGYNASGKGEVTQYFQKKGFETISLSDYLRKEATKQGLELTRENLTALGQTLRKKYDPGFLADFAIKEIDPKKNYVIDSIRHPDEIKILRENLKPFVLFGIDAPVKVRYERSQQRGRQENANTLEEFIQRENNEKKNNPTSQQLHRCMEMCDVLLMNDGSLKDLEKKIESILEMP